MNTYHNTEATRKTVTVTQLQVDSMEHALSAVTQGMCELSQRHQFVLQQLNQALNSQTGMFQMLKDELLSQSTPYTHLSGACAHTRSGRQRDRGLEAENSPDSQTSCATAEEQLAALLDKVQVPHGQDLQDLAMTLHGYGASESAALTCGGKIIQSPQFRRWMHASGSDLLLVEGHLDLSEFDKTTPLSYFCANLVRTCKLEGETGQRAAVLHFFCAQHVAQNDDLRGPRGLLRSLVAQLAKYVMQSGPGESFSLANLACIDRDCYSTPTSWFAEAFFCLLRQMPRLVVTVCIIDDISRFEKPEWRDDYSDLVDLLGHIATSGMRCKVFVASPAKVAWPRKPEADQHIEIRDE